MSKFGNVVMARRGLAIAAALAAFSAVAGAEQLSEIKSSVVRTKLPQMMPMAASQGETIRFALSFNSKDQAGFEQYARSVSDPNSVNYRAYLTPEQIGERFGAKPGVISQAMGSMLMSGIKVEHVYKNHLGLLASGSAANVAKYFHTVIGHYTEDGKIFRTNLTPLQAPMGLAREIRNVQGVDNSLRMKHRALTTLLTPFRYGNVYGTNNATNGGYLGQGRNVAILNWDGYQLSNVPLYVAHYTLPHPTVVGSNISVRLVGGYPFNLGSTSPFGEGDLDIQLVLSSAPLANVTIYDDTYYIDSNNVGQFDPAAPIDTYMAVADDNTADIVTESYGWGTYQHNADGSDVYYPGFTLAAHDQRVAMTIQGITCLAASGDSGTHEFDQGSGTTASVRYAYPDIDPEVMSVGGSVVTYDTVTNTRNKEVTWGTVHYSNGQNWGGTGSYDPYDTPARGFTTNVVPSYQSHISFGAAHPFRLVPDISSHGSGADGAQLAAYAIYYKGSLSGFLGTSASSPATAGSLAVLGQRLFNTVVPKPSRSNVRLGRMQDFLYSKGGSSSVFFDITAGTSAGPYPDDATKQATPGPGFDLATGWGSLNFDGLYHAYLAGRRP